MRIFLAILIAAAAGALGWYLGSNSAADNGNANLNTEAVSIARAATRVKGLGKLEPAGGIVKVLAPQGQEIETLFDLKVGDRVEVDQPIGQLAGRTARQLELDIAHAKRHDALRQLELEQSKGNLKRSSAQIAVDQADSLKAKINSKAEQIDLLRDQKAAAEEQLQSLINLDANPLTANMVGDSDLVKQRLLISQLDTKIKDASMDAEQGRQEAARAKAAAQNDLKTVELLLDDGEKAVPLATLEAAINAAETALDMTELKAPIAGTILDIVVRPGDSVTNKPVMVIGNTDKIVCVTEINDVNFRLVKVGHKATISSIALEQELTGKVVSKGIMIGPPSMRDPNPFARVDRKTGRVVVALDDSEAARRFINLQVDVEIEIDDSSKDPE